MGLFFHLFFSKEGGPWRCRAQAYCTPQESPSPRLFPNDPKCSRQAQEHRCPHTSPAAEVSEQPTCATCPPPRLEAPKTEPGRAARQGDVGGRRGGGGGCSAPGLPPAVRLQGPGDLSDYWPNNNEQRYSNTSNYCHYSVGRGRRENENTEGAERSAPGKACRGLEMLCSEKGFNQQRQICRASRKNECIVHGTDFSRFLQHGLPDNPPDSPATTSPRKDCLGSGC